MAGRLKILLLSVLISALRCNAETFIVTDSFDSINPSSLRGAIIAANSAGGTNTIVINADYCGLSLVGPDEDGAYTGDLDITNGVVFLTAGSTNRALIDAGALGDRVFQVFSNAELAVSNVLIQGGHAVTNCSGEPGSGGGICNFGSLVMLNCAISNCNSSGGIDGDVFGANAGAGGGLFNMGTAVLVGAVFSRNSALTGGISRGTGTDGEGGGGNGGDGAGIYNGGILAMTNCVVSSNVCGDGGHGGDDYTETYERPPGTICACTYFSGTPGSNGGSGGRGGGVFNTNQLVMVECTISHNLAGNGAQDGDFAGVYAGDGGDGGGICNLGSLVATRCAIAFNQGGDGAEGHAYLFSGGSRCGHGGHGGGVYNSNIATFESSTISGNKAGTGGTCPSYSVSEPGMAGLGGGVYNNSSLNLIACTVARNTAGSGGNGEDGYGEELCFGGMGGSGGGVFSDTNSVSAMLANCLIAENSAGTGGIGGVYEEQLLPDGTINFLRGTNGSVGIGNDLHGRFISMGHNLLAQIDGSSGITNILTGDISGTLASPLDPRIGGLQNNGGSTPTHSLLTGSPAIDQGKSASMSVDQRGRPRAHDYFSVQNVLGGDGSDIGAFEADAPILNLTASGTQIILSWDIDSPGYIVETATSMEAAGDWSAVANPASITGVQFKTTNSMTAGRAFFRLRAQ